MREGVINVVGPCPPARNDVVFQRSSPLFSNSKNAIPIYTLKCETSLKKWDSRSNWLKTVGLNWIWVLKIPQQDRIVWVGTFYIGELVLTLKKNFPWKFWQKPLKSVNFLVYWYIDLNDISILKFWFLIYTPGEISNHLICHTIYIHKKINFPYFRPLLQFL